MNSRKIAIIEVGTTRTVCMVGEPTPEGKLVILGVGTHKTTGLRKGEVTELEYASMSVKSAVDAVSASARCSVNVAWIVFSGGGVRSVAHWGTSSLPRPSEITADCIEEAHRIAADQIVPNGYEEVHRILQNYVIDDSRVTLSRPVGLHGSKLRANFLSVFAQKASLSTISGVVEEAKVDVTGCFFAALAASEVVLTQEQKDNGVLLIHIGGGTTSYVAYVEGVLHMAFSFAVGGDHVTNDIQQAFHLNSAKVAEIMKISTSSAVLDGVSATKREPIPMEATASSGVKREYSVRSLNKVVNARYDEMLKIIYANVERNGVLPRLAEIVLTGGGAYQRGLPDLVEKIFRVRCTLPDIPLPGYSEETHPLALAAAYGALTMAWRQLQVETPKRKGSFVERILGRKP